MVLTPVKNGMTYAKAILISLSLMRKMGFGPISRVRNSKLFAVALRYNITFNFAF